MVKPVFQAPFPQIMADRKGNGPALMRRDCGAGLLRVGRECATLRHIF
jgi:hypothetical protein